jgi:hypothetical protein
LKNNLKLWQKIQPEQKKGVEKKEAFQLQNPGEKEFQEILKVFRSNSFRSLVSEYQV